MKKCPNCQKIYADDLFFCLDDGVALRKIVIKVDPNAPTEAPFDIGSSLPTEVLPGSSPTPQTSIFPATPPTHSKSPSKLPYLVIFLLLIICVILAAALVVANFDRLFPSRDAKTKSANDIRPTPAGSPVTTYTPAVNAASPVTNQPAKQQTVTYDPTGRWRGSWSTASGTLYDFELNLIETGSNALKGEIQWTMRKTARPDKMDKIGLSATEYVRGSIDPQSGLVNISGYGKDDPNGMLVMLDVYKLNVSSDGQVLSGTARNGGKWNGHIKLTR